MRGVMRLAIMGVPGAQGGGIAPALWEVGNAIEEYIAIPDYLLDADGQPVEEGVIAKWLSRAGDFVLDEGVGPTLAGSKKSAAFSGAQYIARSLDAPLYSTLPKFAWHVLFSTTTTSEGALISESNRGAFAPAIILRVLPNGNISAIFRDDNSTQRILSPSIAVNDGNLHLVSFYAEGDDLFLFVDGAFVMSGSRANLTSVTTNSFNIGATWRTALAHMLSGQVYFFRATINDDLVDVLPAINKFYGLSIPRYSWYVGNADAQIQVTPTYDGSGQAVHPSVVYVPEGWNGYTYWMAMTPYPYSSESHENPSILASSDGDAWVVPDGLTNPIEPKPDNTNLSDPDLVLVGDTMYCFWRESYEGEGAYDRIYRRESTDGINWINKTLVFDLPEDECLSPTICYDGSRYWLYCMSKTGGYHIEYRTAPTIEGPWSSPEPITLSGTTASTWHLDALYDNGQWTLLVDVGGTSGTFVAQSLDGINFAAGGILNLGISTGYSLYKATAVQTETGLDIWLSAQLLADGSWNIWRASATYLNGA